MSTYPPLTRIGMAAPVQVGTRKCCANRLAPEVLSMIFLEAIAPSTHGRAMILPTAPDSIPEDNEVDTKPLHTLTHVCRYWREVALGNPALWRRIHDRCDDQMQAFLERSRPLTIILFLDTDHWGASEEESIPPPMESVVQTQAERLHRLDLLVVPARQNIPLLLGSLQVPHLEVLTMTSPCMYPPSGPDPMTRGLLFNSETSLLKALAISPIVNWIPSCTSFPQLTHLFISLDQRGTGVCHPWDILQLLSNAPALAYLHVDSLLYDAPCSGSWRPPSDPVPLPLLRSLVFTSCSRKLIHAILSHLLLPEDVFIRLHDILSGGINSDAYYPTPLPNVVLRPPTSLDVCMGDQQILMVADGPTSGLWFEAYQDLVDPDPVGWERWLLNLPQCIPLSHVTYLRIYLYDRPFFLPGLLDSLPRLAHLAILLYEADVGDPDRPNVAVVVTAFSAFAVLCRTLSPTQMETQTQITPSHPRIRCPALRILTIAWLGRASLEGTAQYPRLPEMLAARALAGHPIPHVAVQPALYAPWSDSPEPPQSSGLKVKVNLSSRRAGGAVTALEIFRDFAPLSIPRGTRYDVVPWPTGNGDWDGDGDGDGEWDEVRPRGGLCAFEMRDVWRVAGEDRYWEVDSSQQPGYGLELPCDW